MSKLRERQIEYWFYAWLRERIFPGLWWIVPLSIFVVVMGGTANWFVRTIVAIFALGTLRLWDDLQDTNHDRLRHPERILCQLPSLSSVYRMTYAGLVISVFLVGAFGAGFVKFVFVLPFIYCASTFRRQTNARLRGVWAHLILLKVPALMLGLSQYETTSGAVLGRALGLYGFVGAYEVLHDGEVRHSLWAYPLFIMDLIFLFAGLGQAIEREASR